MSIDKQVDNVINKRFRSIRNQGKFKGRGKEVKKRCY